MLLFGMRLLAVGCGEPPRSFALVSIEEAQDLLRQGGVVLVDAFWASEPVPDPLPGGIRWGLTRDAAGVPAEIPAGGVLAIGSSASAAYRSAAALARAGNQPVYACIPKTKQERSALFAVALQMKESPGGRDS